MDIKFKYEVHPRIPIRTLIPQKAVIRPTQLDLTKDEVKLCLQHGPVFRVFDRNTQVRATLYNLDELHVEKYSTPGTKANVDPAKKVDVCESIVIPKTEEDKEEIPSLEELIPKEEAPVVEEEPEIKENPIEEAPIAEKIIAEEAPVVEEPAPEAPIEEPTETEESVESDINENKEEVSEIPSEESVEADEEDEEDDVEEEEEDSEIQHSNQYHPQRKKKKHH